MTEFRNSAGEPLIRKLVFSGFAATVALSPLPLGAARPWSAAVLMVLLGVCALGWAWTASREQETPGVSLSRLVLPLLLYGAALLWGGAQTLPLLPAEWAHPLWSEAEAVLGELPRMVSMTPAAGRECLMHLLGYGLAFLLAVQMGRSGTRAGRLIDILALAASGIAAYGLSVYLAGIEKIFWLDKWAYHGYLTATLVNRNHYATLAGLGLLCVLAALLRRVDAFGNRACLRRLLAGQDWILAGLLAAMPVLVSALLFTRSRAGIAATLAALVVFFVLGRRWKYMLIQFAILVGFAVLALVVLDQRLGELAADGEQRFRVYQLSWGLLEQRPWLGIGLGGFADAFQAIRPVQVTQTWPQAHNSWLELMIELGIPASLSLFFSLLWAGGRCVIGAATRHYDGKTAALGAAASVLVGLHALVDFSLQIPAVAVTYATILGLGVAQSWSSRLGKVVQ